MVLLRAQEQCLKSYENFCHWFNWPVCFSYHCELSICFVWYAPIYCGKVPVVLVLSRFCQKAYYMMLCFWMATVYNDPFYNHIQWVGNWWIIKIVCRCLLVLTSFLHYQRCQFSRDMLKTLRNIYVMPQLTEVAISVVTKTY